MTHARACAPRARRWAPTAGWGWTATGSSRTPPTRSSSRARSRTSASAGWRTSSRRATRAWSPRSGAAARCRSRWATSREASYHPESILAHDAVDVERIDVTTYGGHHSAARHARADRGSRRLVRAAHVRPRPLPGLQRARLTTSRSSGASPAAASTSSPTPSRSPSSATAAWIRCPRRPASARCTTRPGSRSNRRGRRRPARRALDRTRRTTP